MKRHDLSRAFRATDAPAPVVGDDSTAQTPEERMAIAQRFSAEKDTVPASLEGPDVFPIAVKSWGRLTAVLLAF